MKHTKAYAVAAVTICLLIPATAAHAGVIPPPKPIGHHGPYKTILIYTIHDPRWPLEVPPPGYNDWLLKWR
jgi:hypothetical protein